MRRVRMPVVAGVSVLAVLAVLAAVAVAGAALGSTTALHGFDTASAPSASQMHAWRAHSNYRAVGVYIPVASGSDDRHDKVQKNLTKGWVRGRRAEGWSIIPIYLGLQAPGGCGSDRFWQMSLDPGTAYLQGRSAADDASAAVARLGIAGAPVYYDLEAYGAGCSSAVRAFIQGWTVELHADGNLAGLYGSRSSTMADVTGMLTSAACVRPDAVWPATDNGKASVSGIPPLPNNAWSSHQRINQLRLGHSEKHGGVTLSIDTDYVDGPVVGPTSIPTPAPTPSATASSKPSTTASSKPSTTASSKPSASATTTPPPAGACVPGPPVSLSAQAADGSITLHWTRPDTGGTALTGYTVTNVASGRTYNAGPNTTHRTIGNLTDGTSYTFTVTARNAVGTSFSSWRVLAVPVGKPGPMAAPTVTVHGHRVAVSWAAPAANGSPITGYRVYLDGTLHRVAASRRSITFTGVKTGSHTVRVAANNAVGRGESSHSVRVAVG